MVKLSSFSTFTTKIAVPIVIILFLMNIFLMLHLHRHTSRTTMIISEAHNNGNVGASSSDINKDHIHDKDIRNGHVASDTKPSSNEDTPSNTEEKNEHESKTNTKQDEEVIAMKDDMVDGMLIKLKRSKLDPFFPSYFWNASMSQLVRKLGSVARKAAKTLAGYSKFASSQTDDLSNWQLVHRHIRQFSLYDPDDPAVDGLLKDLATLPIAEVEENEGGTEIKVNIRFNDSGRAVLKPMRIPRSREANPDHYVFDDMERHFAEIASFQLDRILGFYRVPPTVGRWINLTSEIQPLAPKVIANTFYTSPVGNKCFFGKCDYYCDSKHPVCGNPHMVEASIMSYLPSRNIARRNSFYQPWRRSYSKFSKAKWMGQDDFCDSVRKEYPFNNGKLLLDMIDVHTFDFVTGNRDRHSFAFFKEWGNYSFPILYDNGRGFGISNRDGMSILKPLVQCCLVRKSTFLKYLKLYTGPEKLSYLMEMALQHDPVAPVLNKGFLTAMDRRVIKLLHAVAECLNKFSRRQKGYRL